MIQDERFALYLHTVFSHNGASTVVLHTVLSRTLGRHHYILHLVALWDLQRLHQRFLAPCYALATERGKAELAERAPVFYPGPL